MHRRELSDLIMLARSGLQVLHDPSLQLLTTGLHPATAATAAITWR